MQSNICDMKKTKKSEKDKENAGRKLAGKVETAMNNEFYLEASMILSFLFEKKIKKLICQIENQLPGLGFTLEQSIKRVKHLHVSAKFPPLTTHFSVQLIDELRTWKNQRNEILKDLPDIHVSHARMERLAKEGVRLLAEWKKSAKAFKSAK
jgi:hypothetical protein